MNTSWTNPLWSIALFVVYVATSCYGLYLIKLAAGWKSPTFVFGFGLYAAGAVMWMVILRLMPLSYAFPIAAGALVIGTMLVGYLFLGESITSVHLAGSLMIIGGIVAIASTR